MRRADNARAPKCLMIMARTPDESKLHYQICVRNFNPYNKGNLTLSGNDRPACGDVGRSLLHYCWWGSWVFSARAPGLLLLLRPGLRCWDWISGSLVLPPLCARGLQKQVHFWTEGAVPCGAGGGAGGSVDGGAAVPSMLTDRRPIYSFFVCFHIRLFHFI